MPFCCTDFCFVCLSAQIPCPPGTYRSEIAGEWVVPWTCHVVCVYVCMCIGPTSRESEWSVPQTCHIVCVYVCLCVCAYMRIGPKSRESEWSVPWTCHIVCVYVCMCVYAYMRIGPTSRENQKISWNNSLLLAGIWLNIIHVIHTGLLRIRTICREFAPSAQTGMKWTCDTIHYTYCHSHNNWGSVSGFWMVFQ